jgi:hypothetical protein
VLAIQKVVDLLSENFAGQFAVLAAGASCLRFDDDTGGYVLELDGRIGFILSIGLLLA